MSSSSLSEALFNQIDGYVDGLAPQIQPRIASELELFQQKTIDSLETQVIDAFRSLFDKNKSDTSARDLNDSAPDAYGGQSLPFADEISKLAQGFGRLSDGASDDLRDIFDLTENRGSPDQARSQDSGFSGGARGFLSSAIDAVQDHLEKNTGGSGQRGFEIGGMLGVISNTLKDASRNPEEKARLISPEIKDRVGEKLRSQHGNIAEQFTRIALDHLKRWLRGNTSTRDIGDGAKGEIENRVKDLVKGFGGLFGKKSSNEEGSRGIDGPDRDGQSDGDSGGFSKMISDKLSTGLAKVHREVRIEFRKVLGEIEKQLFELLPDQFQAPLEKILGGNPFDSQLDRDAGGQADRSFGDDIKAKLVGKIRDLVRKVQETLRESILGVVNGGHRKLEHESWFFVQNIVEQKIQRYLPDVKITVPDDIGNEGVSVGAPVANTAVGGGTQSMPPSGAHHESEPPSGQYGGQHQSQQGYNAPPQYQDSQNYQSGSYSQQGNQSYQQQSQYDRPNQYAPPPQDYQQNHNPPQGHYQQQGDTYQQQGNYQNNQSGDGYQQQDYRPRY
ncbi:hypothetical protein HBH95_023950 [Parastagonospora nodorum]|nr:hypothetical protein HBH95_023950 [Parastagonospora nodorum]